MGRAHERRAVRQTGTAGLLKAAGLSEERTLEELRRIAFYDPAECFDAAGNLLPVDAMPAETRTAVASVKITRTLTSGEGRADEVHEVRFCDKIRALEALATHFGLLVERFEHRVSVDQAERSKAARRRGNG